MMGDLMIARTETVTDVVFRVGRTVTSISVMEGKPVINYSILKCLWWREKGGRLLELVSGSARAFDPTCRCPCELVNELLST